MKHITYITVASSVLLFASCGTNPSKKTIADDSVSDSRKYLNDEEREAIRRSEEANGISPMNDEERATHNSELMKAFPSQTFERPELAANQNAKVPLAMSVPGQPNWVYSPYTKEKFPIHGKKSGAIVTCPGTGKDFRLP